MVNFLTHKGGKHVSPQLPLPVDDVTQASDRFEIAAETVTFNSAAAAGSTGINALDKSPIMNLTGDKVGSYWGEDRNRIYKVQDTRLIGTLTETATSAKVVITDNTNVLDELFETASGNRRYILKAIDNTGAVLYGWIGNITVSGKEYTIPVHDAVTSGAQSWVGTLGSFDNTAVRTVEIYSYESSLVWVTGTVLTKEVAFDPEIRSDASKLKEFYDSLADGEYGVDYQKGAIAFKKATTGTSDTVNYNTRGSITVTFSGAGTSSEQVHDIAVTTGLSMQGLEAKDFDGSALPNNVSAEGDAVRQAGSLYGIGYSMLTTEDGASTPIIIHDAAISTGLGTSGLMNVIESKDFDGAALPNAVGTEGDAVRVAGSLSGVSYTMLTDEDGSDTPLIAHDTAIGTGLGSQGLMQAVEAKDFDGVALPNNVSAEGDAVRPAATLYGVSYSTPVNEDGSSTPLIAHDTAIGTGLGTVGFMGMLEAKDFDGAALPNAVSLEGDAVRPAGSLFGVQYTMLVNEDGSLQYGTTTTPLIVDLGVNNDVTVTGTVTANAGTNLNTSLLALEAGGNLAGAATSLAIMDDWDNAASDGASVSGDVAHDSPDAGEPVKIGGRSVDPTSLPAATIANDRSDIYTSLQGEVLCYLSRLISGEDQTNTAMQVVEKPLAVSTYTPDMDTSTAAEASSVSKASAGNLYSFTATNSSGSARYLQFFNSTTVPAETTVPVLSYYCVAGGTISDVFPKGINFATGIAWCWSSTAATKTVGSTDGIAQVRYK